MKLIIKNNNRDIVKNPNIKIIETTEASFTNQIVFIEENDVPVIKYTDTESMYFIKDLDNLYDRKSKSEVLLNITIDNLEAIGSGNSEPIDSRPYKVYTALLSQSGTDAPVATILENTLGFNVIWSYVSTGLYNTNIDSSENYIVTQGGIQEKLSGQTTEMYNYQFDNNGGVVALAKSWFRAGGTVVPINTLQNHLVEIKIYN